MMMACAALGSQAVSAQALEESKTLDNWYIGLNAGENFKTTHTSVFDNLNPSAGLRIGRWFTPVFGVAAEGEFYFNNKGSEMRPLGTFVKGVNVSLLGTTNFSNWFGGYLGTPRTFEVGAVYGLGFGHQFGNSGVRDDHAIMTGKVGIDFTFNLGAQKDWQLYVEPNYTMGLTTGHATDIKCNANNSAVGVLVGLNYKFGNSNGTHNFKVASRQDEIDALNAKVNELRSANDSKDNTISSLQGENANLKQQLSDCQNKKPEQVVVEKVNNVLQPTVIFGQGKSTIDAAQYANIAMVANYMKNHKDSKVLIKGYASPEGSKEINQRISEARAEAVKDALVKRYKISASRLSTQGMGATDELFDEVDFNRVATFTDTTK